LAFTDSDSRPFQQAQVHRELQDFLSLHPRALVELPRDHGKSVQICIRVLWELGRRPALRVKIVCATEALALERAQFLRHAIARNRYLQAVFPDLRPTSNWAADRFTVRRPAEIIGPSVTALGVGASSTGARADLLVCDDIVDVKSIASRAERDRVKRYFRDNLVNLLEPDGRLWAVFTPWHQADLNADLKKSRAYALFRRPVGDDLAPVWPEKWPRERLEERRDEIGPVSFARAYRLVTASNAETAIRAEWIQFWSEPANRERVILAVDPAVSAKAAADASALVTLAWTSNNQIHCLEALGRRVSAPELVQLIDGADLRWRPDVIVFESNAAFEGMKDLLVRHARFGPKIQPVRHCRDKAARVQVFSVSVQNGSFRLYGAAGVVAPEQQALFDEMVTFPVGEHDDLLDAAAFGTAFLLGQPEPRVFDL
jgi:predicted phage terminase large subunit-like protein